MSGGEVGGEHWLLGVDKASWAATNGNCTNTGVQRCSSTGRSTKGVLNDFNIHVSNLHGNAATGVLHTLIFFFFLLNSTSL